MLRSWPRHAPSETPARSSPPAGASVARCRLAWAVGVRGARCWRRSPSASPRRPSTWSRWPSRAGAWSRAMPAHSLIFVKEVRPGDVRVGDIITFDPPGRSGRVTHRVIARERVGGRWYFRTKGDANPAPDDWRRGLAHPERYRRGRQLRRRPGDPPRRRRFPTSAGSPCSGTSRGCAARCSSSRSCSSAPRCCGRSGNVPTAA